jgi:Domain of unknown function (DUF4394)
MKTSLLIGSLTTLALLPLSQAALLFGVTTDNQLVSFDTSNPSDFQSAHSISGLFDSDGTTPNPTGSILNLTSSPGPTSGSFQLWGLDNHANMYRISLSGAATLVSSGFSPTGFSAGFSFDPFNNNFVYAGDNAENFSLDMNGVASTNLALTYAGGGAPSIFGLGIDQAFGTVFALDATNNSLSTSFQPNFPTNSELTVVGGLGVNVTAFGGLVVDADGNLYASLSTDGNTSSLYSVNSTTGAATSVGGFGAGVGITTLAIPEPSASLLGALGALALFRRRRA